LSILIRLPFYFPAVVDWDESTFVLMAQSVLDGHLPYVQLWDVKPPLLFAFFTLVVPASWHEIAGIRFAGTLCVALAAFLLYLIAGRWWTRPAAASAAVLFILVASLLPSGQATMSEHVMLPALMGAVYLLLHERASLSRLACVGALMTSATLVRLNIVLAVVAVGLVIVSEAAPKPAERIHRLAAYSGGCLAVVVLASLPYVLAGQFPLLWKSTIVGALVRSNSENSALSNLVEQGRYGFGIGSGRRIPSLNAFVWVAALIGLAMIWVQRRSMTRMEERGILVLALLAAATVAGIVMSGGNYPHYLIQAAPFAALFAAAVIQYSNRTARSIAWLLAAAVALASLRPVAAEYRTMLSHMSRHQPLRYGPAYDIAAYLRRENPSGRPVYLLTDHIVYWLMHTYPPTAIAHPSNVSRSNVLRVMNTTTEGALADVFRQAPEFVVVLKDDTLLADGFGDQLAVFLGADYRLAAEIEGRQIYRRKAGSKEQDPAYVR
jgi:4-amino-4-deoxy-L-arabinose transferase-like glycosyltransferase